MLKRSCTFCKNNTSSCFKENVMQKVYQNPRNDFNSLRFNNLLFQITHQMKQGLATSM